VSDAPQLVLHFADWLSLFLHYLLFSLLSVGGAITTAPEMHRYLVDQQHWLSEAQFSSSIAIAQAAPGPNILFVAVLGWNIGINAGGISASLLGVMLIMTGLLLPSTILSYLAASWIHANRDLPPVRAFKQGLMPITIALICATGWILACAHNDAAKDWPLWLLTATVALIFWQTKIHVLWLLAAGALLGWFNIV
jgi:chromate transporter